MNQENINITKSWRKSLSMRFDRNGVLQVKAPKFLLRGQIEAFIKKNTAWIEKEYEKIKKRREDKKWYLFGKPHPNPLLQGEGTNCSSISPQGRKLNEDGSEKNIESFYKSQAKNYIVDRTKELAEVHGFHFKGIRITSASTRWGSCSSKKTLNFSYRLVMAPKETIDYVIIHELCHLRQMNHSKKFWGEVAAIMPEYKLHEKHLKEEGWRYRI